MRKMVNLLVIVAVVCLLSTMTVFGKDKSEYVNLPQDVMINGTLVKKGEYKLKFDEQTGELLFLKGKKVVARTSARLEKREKDALRTEFGLVKEGEAKALRSITFRGERETIVMHEKSGATETPAAAKPTTASTNP